MTEGPIAPRLVFICFCHFKLSGISSGRDFVKGPLLRQCERAGFSSVELALGALAKREGAG